MKTRCDLTDLLTDQCAHCLGHDQRPTSAGLVIHHTMPARRDGRCAFDPDHRIHEGDSIGRTDDGWVCSDCVRNARGGDA